LLKSHSQRGRLVPTPFLLAYAAQKTGWISQRRAIDLI